MIELPFGTRVRITSAALWGLTGKTGHVLAWTAPDRRGYLVRLDAPRVSYGSHGEWQKVDVVEVPAEHLEVLSDAG